MTVEATASSAWYPIARADDVVPRHVYHGQLLGTELAVWRADDGFVNVWENRCLHRGVRLSIGLNEGQELQCIYHGWRYANRTAGCVYIPAHPADAPAQTICNRTFPVLERYGLVWTNIGPNAEQSSHTSLEIGTPFPLRALPFNAPVDLVVARLADYRFGAIGNAEDATTQGNADSPAHVDPAANARADAEAVVGADASLAAIHAPGSRPPVDVVAKGDPHLELRSPESESTVVFFVQPVDAARSVVRGVLAESPTEADRLDILRHHATELARVREAVELEAIALQRHVYPRELSVRVALASASPVRRGEALDPVPAGRADLGDPDDQRSLRAGRQGTVNAGVENRSVTSIAVVVARKWTTATDVAAFELEPAAGQLPTCQPGAHVDIELPNGLRRQYSLTNGPGQLDRYIIAVKLEPDSRGGSLCLHQDVNEGDVLAISPPRNNFPLRRDALRTVLIAGGIGVTPLLSMAQAMAANSLDFELHYFVRSDDHAAFGDVLDRLAGSVQLHAELSAEQTGDEIGRILGPYVETSHVYVCGPGPMLDAARSIAADAGWPDAAVHFEYFRNTNEVDASSTFHITLARSALTLKVNAGETILQVLRRNGVPVDSSCEQGACGSCVVGVVEGEPDHQDVYLTATERAAGDRLVACVSRSVSDRLVLDV